MDNGAFLEGQNNSPNEHSQPQKYRLLPQYAATITATISAFAVGSCLGWTAPILRKIQDGGYRRISINSDQMGWVGSLLTVGAILTCFPCGFLCERFGPKRLLLALIIPFGVGWILIMEAVNVPMLYVGRFLTGVATGACSVAAPLYVSEVVHKDVRGLLGSFFQLMIASGILYAYVMGILFEIRDYIIFCAAIPVVFVALFFTQPESPVYYIKKGKFECAQNVMRQLRGDEYDTDSEIHLIERAAKESLQTVSFRNLLEKKVVRRAFLISLLLMFFQQFSGVNVVIFYCTVLMDATLGLILVGVFLTFGTVLTILFTEKLGRKLLVITSSAVCALSTLTLGLYFTFTDPTSVDKHKDLLPIFSLCSFIFFFAIGLGPIPWMISTEIFAPDLKSMAGAIASTVNWFLAFLITKYFLQLREAVGIDVVFYGFTLVSFASLVFTYFVVPETKGKTILQVQQELEGS